MFMCFFNHAISKIIGIKGIGAARRPSSVKNLASYLTDTLQHVQRRGEGGLANIHPS